MTGIYHKSRQEYIWGLGKGEGIRAIRITENDLNILEYELQSLPKMSEQINFAKEN